MLNLLIANQNLQNLQNLLNYISSYIPDVRVSYLAQNGQDTFNSMISNHYDMALLDYNLPIYDGLDVLGRLKRDKHDKYKKSIILLTNDATLSNNLKSHDYIFDSFLNTETFSRIISSLKKLVEIKENKADDTHMRTKLINELQLMGYNLAHRGTHYLVDALMLIITLNYDPNNLNKNIYPKICAMHNKSLTNVKTNIIMATDAAYNNIDKADVKKYLKIPSDMKFTAKMVINAILQKYQVFY